METISSGAHFSPCNKHRFYLWRIWDINAPYLMFIGLNPSRADAATDDPTIKRVTAIARHNGYGGVYMLNCFPFVTPYPEELKYDSCSLAINRGYLENLGAKAGAVVFAWGNFPIVKKLSLHRQMLGMFPKAKALHINKNGSPKHPLYCRKDSPLIDFKP